MFEAPGRRLGIQFAGLVLALTALPAAAQTASLVADLNPAAGETTNASQILLVPGKTFFVSYGPRSGPGPWVSDGTQAGTRMLTEACPDSCDGIRLLGSLGGVALWTSDQGLWRSDGTRPGTYRLDGNGVGLSGDGVFLGNAYITFGCGAAGCALWRTDGTTAGTRSIESHSQGGVGLTAAGPRAFFVRTIALQQTLWVTDGTAAGTRQLAVIPPSPGFPGAWVKGLTAVGNRLFFGASSQNGDEVWTSDGTPAGTHPVTHFSPTSPFGALGEAFALQASGQRAYFILENSPDAGIWRSDGTTQGTQLIARFPSAVRKSSSDGRPDFVEEVAGGRAIFQGPGGPWVTDGDPETAAPLQCGGPCPTLTPGTALYRFGQRAVFVTNFDEIWGTDGTAAGTHKLASCSTFPCPSYQELQTWPQGLGFIGFDAAHGTELWVTDGTPAGTKRLTDVPGHDLGLVSERAPVAASDGHRVVVLAPLAPDGKALWIADKAGTRLLAALPKDGGSSDPMDFQALPSNPSNFVFTACSAGREVWRTDGTAAGTVALTSGSRDICGLGSGDTGLGLTPAGGLLFFWRTDGFSARDLWRTDGTAAGTLRLTTTGNLQKEPMTAFQGKLYFAVNSSGGPEVWKSDGTPAGTVQAFSMPPANGLSEIAGLTALAGSLWFVVPDQGDDHHSELWRSDGTQSGTLRVDGIPGAAPPLAALGNQVFFLAPQPGSSGGTIWRTDGTPAGTYQLVNSYAGDGVIDHAQMAMMGGSLFFIARPAGAPYFWTLYRTDGTPQGTLPLAPINTAGTVEEPQAHLTAVAGRLYFVADDGVHGRELWTSDGTAAGTHLVRDIAPGAPASEPDWLAAAGTRLYFSADDGTHGNELWQSDGTEAGTHLAQDIAPEADSSFPQRLAAIGDRLWLSADDGATGRELWTLPLADPGTCHPAPDRLCLSGSRYQVEASWRTAAGTEGRGTAVALTADTGYFWFFSPSNVETVVKVLDGTGVNGHVWVFYGALSNVEYTLTVTDTQTGLTRRYFNPLGQLASVGDVHGFGPLGASGANPPATIAPPSPLPLVTTQRTAALAPCQADAHTLCLSDGPNGGRFAVTVTWKDFQGHTGQGIAASLSGDTGTFWFFNGSNVELVVKALDGRPVNNHFWLFYGALSNVEYTLTVTDTQTGTKKTYTNPSGRFASVADTLAF